MVHKARILTCILIFFLVLDWVVVTSNLVVDLRFEFLLALFCLLVFFFQIKWVRWLAVLLIVTFLGFYRYSHTLLIPVEESKEVNGIIHTVITEPYSKGSSQIFFVERMDQRGKYLVITEQFPTYGYGESIEITGQIVPPENGSADSNQTIGVFLRPKITYTDNHYLAMAPGKYVALRKRLITFRRSLEENISMAVSEPQAGLLNGILFGTKTEIDPDFYQVLVTVGLVHIVALSGYNITVISEFLRVIGSNISFRLSVLLPALGVGFFVLGTAMSASVVRAAIMSFFLLFGKVLGRQSDAINAVLLAGVLMVVHEPRILVYDIGFQLSFAALLGILYVAPLLNKHLQFLGKTAGEVLGATLAAQITTWAIISFYFGRVSMLSAFSNLIVLPLMPLVMLLGLVVGIAGFLWNFLALKVGYLSWLLLRAIMLVAERIAELPWASVEFSARSPLFIVGYYIFIIESVLIARKLKNAKR